MIRRVIVIGKQVNLAGNIKSYLPVYGYMINGDRCASHCINNYVVDFH